MEHQAITTQSQLKAVPHGAIVRDGTGQAHVKLGEDRWYETGVEGYGQDRHIELPAQVVYKP